MTTTKSFMTRCPHCRWAGEMEGLTGQLALCPGCNTEFRALEMDWLEQQIRKSPVMRLWWLAPGALMLALAIYGSVSWGTVAVLTGLTIGIEILRVLGRIEEKLK